jgi:hypothetical protein
MGHWLERKPFCRPSAPPAGSSLSWPSRRLILRPRQRTSPLRTLPTAASARFSSGIPVLALRIARRRRRASRSNPATAQEPGQASQRVQRSAVAPITSPLRVEARQLSSHIPWRSTTTFFWLSQRTSNKAGTPQLKKKTEEAAGCASNAGVPATVWRSAVKEQAVAQTVILSRWARIC